MATIHLTALARVTSYGGCGGPDVPCRLDPVVRMEHICGEDKPESPVLWISIGHDNVCIWPVDSDEIAAFGKRLIELAEQERASGMTAPPRRAGDAQ